MLTIDRIEGKIVVADNDGEQLLLELSAFDEEVSEGDVIVETSCGRYAVDRTATDKRRKNIINLQNSLWD